MAEVKVVVKNTVEGGQDVASFGQRLNSLVGTAANLAAGMAAAGAATKKAFDLSREGAQLNQLASSFDRMNAAVFKTPGLLDDMSAAARGTIKETDLMAGLLKLTAGASDELARRFAEAAPQLLEIAKASNKLNPALGDTAFLYDSIATGIKRASPLILDNLGIVVKVGEANETMAAQLGKTVQQLTAEEQQMALLNATMEAGGKLIDQVGGSVDSQADAWARLEVMVGDQVDTWKRLFAEGIGPTISALAGDYGAAVDSATAKTQQMLTSTEDLASAMARANESYNLSRTLLGRLTGTSDDVAEAFGELAMKTAVSADSYEEFQDAIEASGMDLGTLRRLLAETGAVTDDVNVSVAEAVRQFYELQRAIAAAADADETMLGAHRRYIQAQEDADNAARAAQTQQELLSGAVDITSINFDALGLVAEDAGVSLAAYTIQTRNAEAAARAAADAADAQRNNLEGVSGVVRALEGRHVSTLEMNILGLDSLYAAEKVLASLRGMSNMDQPDPFNIPSAPDPNAIGDALDPSGRFAGETGGGVPIVPPGQTVAPDPVGPGFGINSAGGGRNGGGRGGAVVNNTFNLLGPMQSSPEAIAAAVARTLVPRG